LPTRSLVASFLIIRSLLGAQRARFLMILTLWATGLMSVVFASEAQALRVVDAGGPYDIGGELAYANPENDVAKWPTYAITIDDARSLEAAKRVRLHHFLQPYEVMKPDDRPAVQWQIKEAASNKKRPARHAPPPPTTAHSTFAALPAVFMPTQPPLSPAPGSAARVPNIVLGNGQQVEIVSPDELNSIDLAADARAPEQATRVAAASPSLLAQALSIIGGALAGLAVGLFLMRWLAIGTDFQPRGMPGDHW
jgi:hypothetical protein